MLSNDLRPIYNNTKENLNIGKNLNLKNKNKLNINLNNEKKLFKYYTNRELGKTRKITSFKNNKKLNPSTNSKNFLYQGNNIYSAKNETQYPINLSSIISKNKFLSFNKKLIKYC